MLSTQASSSLCWKAPDSASTVLTTLRVSRTSLGTSSNVFYELGLAHALKKPVILITQSISDVPFDLKSYRLLEYSTHFGRIEIAKERLNHYADGFARGGH